jgi:hypothetical protein
MIPSATQFKELYTDHHQIQRLDTPGYQGTDLQANGLFVVAQKREVVVIKSLPSAKVVYRGRKASISECQCKVYREPTSGLEPLTPAHYECAVNGC